MKWLFWLLGWLIAGAMRFLATLVDAATRGAQWHAKRARNEWIDDLKRKRGQK